MTKMDDTIPHTNNMHRMRNSIHKSQKYHSNITTTAAAATALPCRRHTDPSVEREMVGKQIDLARQVKVKMMVSSVSLHFTRRPEPSRQETNGDPRFYLSNSY